MADGFSQLIQALLAALLLFFGQLGIPNLFPPGWPPVLPPPWQQPTPPPAPVVPTVMPQPDPNPYVAPPDTDTDMDASLPRARTGPLPQPTVAVPLAGSAGPAIYSPAPINLGSRIYDDADKIVNPSGLPRVVDATGLEGRHSRAGLRSARYPITEQKAYRYSPSGGSPWAVVGLFGLVAAAGAFILHRLLRRL